MLFISTIVTLSVVGIIDILSRIKLQINYAEVKLLGRNQLKLTKSAELKE
jgi:hypothetical protein